MSKKMRRIMIGGLIIAVMTICWLIFSAMTAEAAEHDDGSAALESLDKSNPADIVFLDTQLLDELLTDQTTHQLEAIIGQQEDEEILLALQENFKDCKDDGALRMFFVEEYAHCK